MKILNVKINQFRGLKNVNIDINEMLNFIVSDNNVGKTRILEAINQFYVGKEDGDIEITYELSEVDKNNIIEAIKEIDEINDNYLTIHYINKEYDKGKTIFQAKCPVLPGDTSDTLAARVHELEYAFFPKVIEDVILSTN